MLERVFHDCFGKEYSLANVVDEIIAFMHQDPGRQYRVIIGTDSEDHGGADFVSAVVVHRVGNGGRYWWRRTRLPHFKALRDRIWQEVLFSLEIARGLIDVVSSKNLPKFQMEIHVDVGTKGETRTILQEVVGAVRGSGFMVKTKPESFGASNVADRHV